ncbi:MAG: type I DNA topoisomerase [Parcubacteria group bacterium]|nr:type I DNA topoisomerase [Parcubacteria group bacterium]
MKLVIVESPTKAKTISRFLGKDYRVESSYGHVRDLPKSKIGVDVEHNFIPKYIIPAKAKKHVKELKEAAEESENIILATDEDREGEAIAWHLAKALGLDEVKTKKEKEKTIERIVFHEITKSAIENALKHSREIDMNLVNAQQGRRILDRLVGYELSPFLWKKVAKGLSAGRVQSVAVRLIVEREEEIKNFQPEEYWTIAALLKPKKDEITIEALLIKIDDKVLEKFAIKTKNEAENILKNLANRNWLIAKIEKKEINKSPSPPFSTSTLQQEAWAKYHFSAKQTMMLAQQLYEGVEIGEEGTTGLITYMRTDSLNIAESAQESAEAYIKKEMGENYWRKRLYKTKSKTAQEAHEAIRPTEAIRTPESVQKYLDSRQFKVYDLIWRRFVASQMSDAVFSNTHYDIEAKNDVDKKLHIFRASGSIIKFDGFLKIYPSKKEEIILPELKEKDELKLLELKPLQHFTEPPARYSEASLIKTLEKNGIGRPSTYAPTLSTIQERGYVQKNDQKRLAPTEMGILVNKILVQHFPKIVDLEFTAQMEEGLDKIAEGEIKYETLLNDFYGPFKKNLEEKYEEVKKEKIEEKTEEVCEKCGKPMVIKMSRFGKFLACTGFPECRNAKPIKNTIGLKCLKCEKGEIVKKRTRKGKFFYGCSRYPECDFALWDEPTGQKCPQCGSLLVKTLRNQIKCSNKTCDFKEM